MSLALAHFAFGAAMTTLLVTYLLPTIPYPRTVILAGGVWAMLPDLHHVSPIAAQQLRHLHQTSVWTDVFWLHRTWDRVDPTDSKVVAAGLLVVLGVVTMLAERRNYRAPRVVTTLYDSYVDGELSDQE